MIKLYREQAAEWRLSFLFDEEDHFLTVRPGNELRTLVVNLGNKERLDAERVRQAAAKAVKAASELGGASAVLQGGDLACILGGAGLSALVHGAYLALYEAQGFQTGKKKERMACSVAWPERENVSRVLREANVLAKAVCFARDLVNAPANRLTPQEMAWQMSEAARGVGVEAQVLDEAEAAALGMEAFLTVGGGSAHPPRLIVLRYRGGGNAAPVALVGKGITCDTGGYCLKAASSMKGIKGDMAGGAAVCGAILALAENRVPLNVTAVIPAAENRISPDSFIPGDVIGSMSGKTIEIGNTDAEGRLVLADAVTYALQKENACKIVDIATLTGAVVGMFGFTTAGLLAGDEAFYEQFRAASALSGEQYWRLPMFPEYKKMIESTIADLSNVSSDGCGTITAGLFIGAFTEGKPWIHLDIAGTAWVDSPHREYQSKGATGAGVTTLYELCRGMAEGEF